MKRLKEPQVDDRSETLSRAPPSVKVKGVVLRTQLDCPVKQGSASWEGIQSFKEVTAGQPNCL